MAPHPFKLPEVQVLDSTEAAAVVLTPLRLQLLSMLINVSSATRLAKELGKPRQIINYHLRELEKQGLIVHVEDIRRGNVTERLLRRSAASYLIGPGTLGSVAALPERTPDKLSAAYLISMAAKLIRDLGRVVTIAHHQDKRVATLSLHTKVRFASAEKRAEYIRELSSEFLRIAAKYNEPDNKEGRDFDCLLGLWPTLKEDDSNPSS